MAVYLDYNATTPPDDRVVEAMAPYLGRGFGNPSSLHVWGRQARAAIEQAREQVADLVNAHPGQVIFTSGGTEANNLALLGFAAGQGGSKLVISPVEHASLLAPAQRLQRSGWQLDYLKVDDEGSLIDEGAPADADLVSLMLANNETGVIHDVAALVDSLAGSGCVVHTDAVQAVGKMPVDFTALGVQMMSVSSHKLYGPMGAGALIVDRAIDLAPLMYGSGQERGLRPGTENVPSIVGFGVAAELAKASLAERTLKMSRLLRVLEEGLSGMPQVVMFSRQAPRLSNTLFFAVKGVDGATLLQNLDRAGYAISSGAACDSALAEPSHVLLAMGVDPELARGAVRVSLGEHNTLRDIEEFVLELARQLSLFEQLTQRVLV